MEDLAAFLPLLAIAVLFWLIIVRPASRRQKQTLRMQAELEVGQRVMMAAGIFGTIVSLSDDRVRLEIAPGVEVEVVRAAISGVAGEPAGEPAGELDGDQAEHPGGEHPGGEPDARP